jgi:plastocyanin
VFEKQDDSIPHNVQINDASGAELFVGEVFPGVDTRDYQVQALPVGEYPFICTVHPNMTGTLTTE